MVKLWILHFIPDELLQKAILLLIFVGISLYPVGIFTNFLPGGKKYKNIIFVIATLITIIGFYFEGSYSTEMMWRERVKEVQAQVEEAKKASGEANTKLETKHKEKQKVRVEYYTRVQERIVEKKVQIDAKCELDPSVPQIHNEAAQNPNKGKVSVGDVKE